MIWPRTRLHVTTRSGLVHLVGCKALRPSTERWPWNPVNDGPGVNTACGVCMPEGLPGEGA